MQKKLIRLVSVVLFIATICVCFSINTVAANDAAQIQQSINDLEKQSADLEAQIKELQKDINSQKKLKNAIEQKISVVQEQINLCNKQINNLNNTIAANNAKIEENNKKIEQDKLSFKKRIRAIQMSNTSSNLQLLLGAEDFSDFLQLTQLTVSVSARDKLIIEKLVASIKELKKKQEENNKLLEEQVEIKKVVAQKQSELMAEGYKIQNVINDIDKNQTSLENTNKQIEAQIKKYKNTLNSLINGSATGVYDGSEFRWPTTYYRISAGFKSNDSVHNGKHDGIDIIGSYPGQISGAPVYAIADGTVDICKGGCSHNYPKPSGSCGCNGNFGNYVRINHGSKDGTAYLSIYGHMSSLATSNGAKVKKGQIIGYVGSTGWSTGYHLHFGIATGYWNSSRKQWVYSYVDPMGYYRKVG